MAEVAALGLACNVLQLAEHGITFARTVRELYVNGDEANEVYADLKALTQKLERIVQKLESDISKDHLESYPVLARAKECQAGAQEILNGYNSVAKSTVWGTGKRKALRSAFKLLWDDSKIKSYQAKFESIRRDVTDIMIASLSDAMTAGMDRQQEMVGEIHGGLRTLSDRVGFGATVVTGLTNTSPPEVGEWVYGALLDAVYDQNENTAAPETFQMTAQRRQSLQTKFLAGLRFDGMIARVTTLAKAHKDTFRWIFEDEPEHTERLPKWDSFKQWLESDEKLYWITGKAGSGKSTLMKFISQPAKLVASDALAKPKCLPYLRKWAGSDLAIASYYFWASGTPLQTSHEGLFRTLLYQVLQKHPGLIPDIFPRRWAALCLFDQDRKPFTPDELQRSLEVLVFTLGATTKLCFFIDGLDEFKGDQKGLLELLTAILANDSVKLCVSSRPESIFENYFKRAPGLRLQDLTRNDIEQYVLDRFRNETGSEFPELKRKNPSFANSMVDTIVTKAEGVFLWVNLVVTSLLEGMMKADKLAELQRRLDTLPQDLESLYRAILEDIEKAGDMGDAALYFTLTAACREPPPAMLLWQSDPANLGSPRSRVPLANWAVSDFGDEISDLRKRLNARCRGLLEVGKIANNEAWTTTTALQNPKVQYFHRTVKDYMSDQSKLPRRFLEAVKSSSFDPHTLLCSAFLTLFKAHIALDEIPASGATLTAQLSLVLDALCHSAEVAPENLPTMLNLVDDLERAFSHSQVKEWIEKKGPRTQSELTTADTQQYDFMTAIHNRQNNEQSRRTLKALPAELSAYMAREEKVRFGGSFLSLAVKCAAVEYVEARTAKGARVPSGAFHAALATSQAPSSGRRGLFYWPHLLSDWWASRRPAEWPLLIDALAGPRPDSRMIAALLTKGADPNVRMGTHQMWEWATALMMVMFGTRGLHSAPDPYLEDAWIETVRVMKQHGGKLRPKDIQSILEGILQDLSGTVRGTLALKDAVKLLVDSINGCQDYQTSIDVHFLAGLDIGYPIMEEQEYTLEPELEVKERKRRNWHKRLLTARKGLAKEVFTTGEEELKVYE